MEGSIYECFIKYSKLKTLLEPFLTSVKFSNKVDIIIDAKSLIRKAYRVADVPNYKEDAIEDISSSLINLIGHFRNFVYKYSKYSNIYVLYSEHECPNLQALYPDYKTYYYNKYFHSKDRTELNNIITTAMHIGRIVCEYIPHVVYINTEKFDEYIYAHKIASMSIKNNNLAILLSDDPLMYQCLNNNTIALSMKGDNSLVYTTTNTIANLSSTKTDTSTALLPLLLSITGMPKYSITGIGGYAYKKATELIDKLRIKGVIIDKEPYMILPLKEMLNKEKVLTAEALNKINTNYNVIYPTKLEFLNDTEISNACQKVQPQITMAMLTEVNTRYFLLHPINFISLLRGESVE